MPRLLHGDCLDLMAGIATGSVDMILCDLPYGTTACKWDSVIPFEPLWAQYKRIAKPNAAIVLTASQPFTTALIGSNMSDFRYSWVWEKSRAANCFLRKNQPLKFHEDVCVFGALPAHNSAANALAYFPQMEPRKPENVRRNKPRQSAHSGIYGEGRLLGSSKPFGFSETIYPKSILKISGRGGGLHPTEKPVALMEYLIRTYTNEGETVLDNCMGSGTTGVACANTGREFIGIEKDAAYFEIARERINATTKQMEIACSHS